MTRGYWRELVDHVLPRIEAEQARRLVTIAIYPHTDQDSRDALWGEWTAAAHPAPAQPHKPRSLHEQVRASARWLAGIFGRGAVDLD